MPALASRRGVGRDAGEVRAERALEAPEVVRHLHPQPELGAVAAELAEAERQLGRDRLLQARCGLIRPAEAMRQIAF